MKRGRITVDKSASVSGNACIRTWKDKKNTYRTALLVRRRIHWGTGRFCFCALPIFCLVRKVLLLYNDESSVSDCNFLENFQKNHSRRSILSSRFDAAAVRFVPVRFALSPLTLHPGSKLFPSQRRRQINAGNATGSASNRKKAKNHLRMVIARKGALGAYRHLDVVWLCRVD